MRSAIVSFSLLAACGSQPGSITPSGPPPPGTADPDAKFPDGTHVVDTPVAAPASTPSQPAQPFACGTLDMSTPAPARCAPKLLATKAGGPLVRVWETACQVYYLRNDGAVGFADGNEHYTYEGDPVRAVVAPRRTAASVIAGASTFASVSLADGTRFLVVDRNRCERLPLPPTNNELVGTGDGRVFYLGHPDGVSGHGSAVGLQIVERKPDATWRISPPLRTGIYLSAWMQNGRAVFGYTDPTTNELGYYDLAANQLRPIRRGAQLSGLQLAPGVAADEPPSALYTDAKGTALVDIPDPDTGYRQLAQSLAQEDCPDGGTPDPSRRPSGRFVHQSNPILLRTSSGGLHLAYTDVRGRCTYTYQQRGYLGRTRTPSREERELFARPPPPPPAWRIDQVPESAHLVLVAVERGRFAAPKRIAIPARAYSYTGPWQFHPAATPSRIRLAIGSTLIDLDPQKLGSAPALAKPWPTTTPTTADPPKTIVIPTTPANAPPLPPLRAATIAPIAITVGVEQKVDAPKPPHVIPTSCLVTTRSAPSVVERQLVVKCGYAKAVELAVGGGRVAFTQFSQQGYDPIVEIDAKGDVQLVPRPADAYDKQFQFRGGSFVFASKLPGNAPKVQSSYQVYDVDGATLLGISWERGGELLRGTLVPSSYGPVWDWKPAFATGRTPPVGAVTNPVFLRAPGSRDPTIAFSSDPRVAGDITVRTPDGRFVSLPTWGTGHQRSYRLRGLVAIAIAGAALPAVAAKVDESIVVGFPDGKGGFVARAIAGTERFSELSAIPPGGTEAPRRTPRGPRCTESIAVREREEVDSPQLFQTGNTTRLAYLSRRVREQLRFTVVAPKCGWVTDSTTYSPELVIARLDASGATELVRVPVEYRGGGGFDGATLLLEQQGGILHTIATSYGTSTYTRIVLPP